MSGSWFKSDEELFRVPGMAKNQANMLLLESQTYWQPVRIANNYPKSPYIVDKLGILYDDISRR